MVGGVLDCHIHGHIQYSVFFLKWLDPAQGRAGPPKRQVSRISLAIYKGSLREIAHGSGQVEAPASL